MENTDNLKILVVEDNSLIAFEIRSNIEKMGYEVVDAVASAQAALDIVERQEVSMVILDINLKGDADGISVAQYLDEKNIPFIYLTSYYDEATLDRVNGTNYSAFIPKPFTELDLKLNIELAQRKHNAPGQPMNNKKDFYAYSDNKMRKKIYFNDILYIQSDDNYSVFHTPEKRVLVRIPLKNLEDELGDRRFIKIHRSYIINVDKIESFSNNTVIVRSKNIPISNSHRKEFKQFIKELWG